MPLTCLDRLVHHNPRILVHHGVRCTNFFGAKVCSDLVSVEKLLFGPKLGTPGVRVFVVHHGVRCTDFFILCSMVRQQLFDLSDNAIAGLLCVGLLAPCLDTFSAWNTRMPVRTACARPCTPVRTRGTDHRHAEAETSTRHAPHFKRKTPLNFIRTTLYEFTLTSSPP